MLKEKAGTKHILLTYLLAITLKLRLSPIYGLILAMVILYKVDIIFLVLGK